MKSTTAILLGILAVVGTIAFFVLRSKPARAASVPVSTPAPTKDRVGEVKNWLTVPGAAVDAFGSLKTLFGGGK